MAAQEPATKKAKTDEEAVAESAKNDDVEMISIEAVKEPEQPKKAEPPKELETDAPDGAKPMLKETIGFNTSDTTLNVMPSDGGRLLKSLSDNGFQFLLAGARANVGAKSGRYMFEVKIVGNESFTTDDWCKTHTAQSYMRVGFTTADSSPIVGSDESGICFDTQGGLWHNGKKSSSGGPRSYQDSVMAVVLNLDEKSPNANTLSLFQDGVRVTQPQALPDALKGKTLFPTVAFKNMTVHVNFGTQQLAPLPFKCRMFQDATAKDVAVVTSAAPKDGKYEVVLPVGLPDEGTFEWLDMFHQRNPGYVEISTRSMLAWAKKSDLPGTDYRARDCNDKPNMRLNIPSIDDGKLDHMIKLVAPLQKRNYVIMEVKGNLIEEERKALLAGFSSDTFKKVAHVQLGEPNLEFKKKVQEATLKSKQENADRAFRAAQVQEKRKKLEEKKKKEAEKAAKKRAKEVAKKQKEIQKKAEAEKKAAEKKKAAEEAKEGQEEKKEEDEKEEKEEEEPEDMYEEEPEEIEDDVKDEDPPKVELDAEEKKAWFVKARVPDLVPYVLNTTFGKFSVPAKDEGFDAVKYSWADGAKSQEYLKNWIMEKKTVTRVEDIVPSAWFRQKWNDWEKAGKEWNIKLGEYKAAVAKRADKKRRKEQAAAAAAKKKEQDEARAAKQKEEGKEEDTKEEGDKQKEEAKPMEVEEEEDEPEVVVDFAGLDVFEVQDVTDVGGGMPLYLNFASEDWTMMNLRHELHLLAHAFRKDVGDDERAGVHLDHLGFYYSKYYKKKIYPESFGVANIGEVLALVKDTMYVNDKQVMESQLGDEMECLQIFAKLTEEARRERALRIDLGDATARLKISQGNHHGGGKSWSKGEQRGDYKGYDKGKGGGKSYDKGYEKGKSGGKGGGYQSWQQQQQPVAGEPRQWKRSVGT